MLLFASKFFLKYFFCIFCAISSDRLDASTKTASVASGKFDNAKKTRTENENEQKKKKLLCHFALLKNPNTFQSKAQSSIELGPRNDAESALGPALDWLHSGHVAGGTALRQEPNRSTAL